MNTYARVLSTAQINKAAYSWAHHIVLAMFTLPPGE